jgi:hypothetical protein
MYGYVDKDGDGWRDLPDGSPLVMVRNTESSRTTVAPARRAVAEGMNAPSASRSSSRSGKWPENLKAAQAGNS